MSKRYEVTIMVWVPGVCADSKEEALEAVMKDTCVKGWGYELYPKHVGEYSEETVKEDKDANAPRRCDECGKGMYEGYCIEGGEDYYCSDECLHKHITPEEYANLYDDGNGDTYWTEWEE